MLNTRTRVGRAAAATFAIASVIGLSACQDTPTAAPPTSAAPSSAAPSSESSEAAPSTSEESSSAAPSSSEAPSSSSSSAAPSGDAGDTTLPPEGTRLKFGQPANVRESSTGDTSADGYRLQIDALDKAPDSVYSGRITKTNGTVYYVRYTLTNNGTHKSKLTTSGVNGFMMIPNIAPGQTGKKLIGSTPDCDTDDTELAVGQSAKGCDAYQVSGAEVTEVIWKPGQVIWSK